MFRGSRSWFKALATGLGVVLFVCWTLYLAGKAPPVGLSRALAVAALVCGLLWGLRELVAALRAEPKKRWRALALLALVALGLVVSFVGLDYGVVPRYNRDEGVYRKYASGINQGKPFPTNFIYPHFPFYVDAFFIWVASLFFPGIVSLVESLWDVEGWSHTVRMVLRVVTALYGALVVWPVFRIAERLGGLRAATLGGAFMVLSPLWWWGSHNSTNDVPAAFFATLCLMFVTQLLDEERRSTWLLAGLASGLAAASKYPAGLVATAIIAVWLRSSWRRRRPTASLLWAGLASAGAFLASMPALWIHLDQALHGGKYSRLLSGFDIYKGKGWVGVIEPNNLVYYLSHLAHNLGLPAVLLGLVGLAFAGRKTLTRVAWLLPFPVALLAVICSMTVVVTRNIYPLIPLAAALAGTGVSASLEILSRRAPGWRRALVVPVVAICLALPLARTFAQSVRLSRPDTRELALDWVMKNVSFGAAILRETFTPELPSGYFAVGRLGRHAIEQSFEHIANRDHDLLLLSSHSYARFFREDLDHPDMEASRADYQRLMDSFQLVQEFEPAWHTQGPHLSLRRIEPAEIEYLTARRYEPSEVYLPSRTMRGDGGYSYRHPRHWSAFKGYFEPGPYRLSVTGKVVTPASVEVLDLNNKQYGSTPVEADGTALLELPQRDKFLFYLRLQPGSYVERLSLERQQPEAEPAR